MKHERATKTYLLLLWRGKGVEKELLCFLRTPPLYYGRSFQGAASLSAPAPVHKDRLSAGRWRAPAFKRRQMYTRFNVNESCRTCALNKDHMLNSGLTILTVLLLRLWG